MANARPRTSGNSLGVELEARLLQALLAEWRSLNYALFKSALRPPVIRLADAERPLAGFDRDQRSVVLARALVLGHPWDAVVESLKRLAVEQFVRERLGVDEHPRGPTYRRVCRRLGVHPVPLDAREVDAGPGTDALGGPLDKRLVRIRKLLALAGSPNQHEAETAALMAQRLLLELNLDGPLADAIAAADGSAHAYRQLGPPRPRLIEHDQRLARILTEHFFVEAAWVPVYLPEQGVRAMLLEVCGLEFNLAMAEHVHAFLRATADRLWRDYRAASGCPASDAAAYLAGVLAGFETRLLEQGERLAAEGLVWVPGPELLDYFRRRNPQLRRPSGRGAAAGGEAFADGRAAGQRIVLAPPLASSLARGLALPPARGGSPLRSSR